MRERAAPGEIALFVAATIAIALKIRVHRRGQFRPFRTEIFLSLHDDSSSNIIRQSAPGTAFARRRERMPCPGWSQGCLDAFRCEKIAEDRADNNRGL